MVNFHDPVVIARDEGVSAYQPLEFNSHLSHLPEVVKELWLLVDGFFMWACLLLAFLPFQFFAYINLLLISWEFMITLNYDWRVIQGQCLCRWTIWVHNHSHFCSFCDIPTQQSDLLIW